MFFCDVENKITIDGTSDLYALSGDGDGEWGYLINKRTNAINLRKYGVSVTTSAGTATNCLIIAPDGYDYTTNPLQASYTAEEWAAAEALGLVCLPAAGMRIDSKLHFGGDSGYYWTTPPDTTDPSYSHVLHFYSDGVVPTIGQFRGFSLRLVK